jgi:hypothetical protein
MGSIRSIGRSGSHRKSIKSVYESLDEENNRPTSPIPIPKTTTPAPLLSIQLLPQGFSPILDITSTLPISKEAKKLMDPQNITSGLPDGTPAMPAHREVAATRQTFSNLRFDPDNKAPRLSAEDMSRANRAPTTSPPTPLPGANTDMDLDGPSSEIVPVFERRYV